MCTKGISEYLVSLWSSQECTPYLNVNNSVIQYKARNFRWGCNGKHIQEILWTTTIAAPQENAHFAAMQSSPVWCPPTPSTLSHWSTSFRSLTAYFICPKTKRDGYTEGVPQVLQFWCQILALHRTWQEFFREFIHKFVDHLNHEVYWHDECLFTPINFYMKQRE